MYTTRPYLAMFLLFSLAACRGGDDASKDLSNQVNEQWESVKKQYDALPERKELSDAASSEVQKLFAFEYKVVDIAETDSQDEMQAVLDQIGRERWECFAVSPSGPSLRFFCKRRPDTYLKYFSVLPKFML